VQSLDELFRQFLPDGESTFSTDSAGFAHAVGVPDAIAPLEFAKRQYQSSELPSVVSFDEWVGRQYLDARVVATPGGDVLAGLSNPNQGDWGFGESGKGSFRKALLGVSAVALGGTLLGGLAGAAEAGAGLSFGEVGASSLGFASAGGGGVGASGSVLSAVKDVVSILGNALSIKRALSKDDPAPAAPLPSIDLSGLFNAMSTTSTNPAIPSASDLAASLGVSATATPNANAPAAPQNISISVPTGAGIDPELAKIALYALLAWVAYKIMSRK